MKKILFLFAVLFSISILTFSQKLPTIKSVGFKKDSFFISKFGAVADGVTLNTKSITAAIAACNKNGGGVVVIPGGIWLTGPIILQSNVNLHLQRNSLLQFTSDKSQYPIVATNWEGLPAARNQSPISSNNANNIAITGLGIIDGNGDGWRAVKRDKLTDSQWKKLLKSGGVLSEDKKVWYPSLSSKAGADIEKAGVLLKGKSIADYDSIKDFLRPNLLVLSNSDRILLEGVTFQNSAAWCLHPLMSSNITIRNITVKNPWYAQNGDGLDIESCKNVLVENSSFDVGDDGICIKSGRDEEGRKRGKPTENVIIRNCVVYQAHGGFVIGSEMSGGARNIFVDNCTFIGTDIGLRFKTTRGRGGIVENIYINNIVMKSIPGEAILFDMYYAAKDPIPLEGEKREAPKVEIKPVTEETPQFKNFYINNVVCDGANKALFIRGLPEMSIRNIQIKNLTVKSSIGIEITEAENIQLENIQLVTTDKKPLVDIYNASNVQIKAIKSTNNSEKLLRLGGEKSNQIKWNDGLTLNEQNTEFEFGANKTMLHIQ